ncbi:hypothetical protein [Methanobacterium subterraneum]|uniref:Uncharacterized protein n=1 Tax=Methanobacterium subterraneum TaxID=59277 RepID=A0A7K4DNT4_9EURY|nr:hypothetical protein [Methanobacterium subterraneum]MBW4258146.1 hypothetical protein [Methanobacterium sp. YSL]NMO10147.1 hypothetical protein [Methanobacterium subterraneum]
MNDELKGLKEQLEEHEGRIQILENIIKNKAPSTKKRDSIKEFIILKNPKNNVQKTLVIGYYLENYEEMSSFNVDNILRGFKDAKEKAPPRKRIYDKIASNIDKGHMMVSNEQKGKIKSWVLTNSGEKFVENDLKIKE